MVTSYAFRVGGAVMAMPENQTQRRRPGAVLHIFIVALTVGLVAVAAFFLLQSNRPLTRSEAASAVAQILQAQGPIMVSFHTGLIQDEVNESARDPEYRFLERAGIIKVVPEGNSAAHVSLTVKGSDLLKQIPGVKQSKEPSGRYAYEVPLAEMRLEDVSSIRTAGARHAVVNFTWRWSPNRLGEIFDASATAMRQISSGERSALIDFYGARFYRQAPTSSTVSLVKTADGWELER